MTKSERTYIIAEAGVNHNGSLEMAMHMIDVAAEAGADAVKFQTFKAEKLVSQSAPKAEYQTETTDATESQFEMIKKLELSDADHEVLIQHCLKRGIEFLSTPFDFESVDLLANTFKLSRLKLPSGEITNAPLLLYAAKTGKNIMLSTGMSTLGEVEAALGVLAFGYTGKKAKPSVYAFKEAYCSQKGQRVLHGKVTLLHCTTEYPTPYSEVNLLAMDTLHTAFGLPVGLSDHTPGIEVATAAVARGAMVIEKHFTLNKGLPGPDHRASLEPHELKQMVRSIRNVEAALGIAVKAPSVSEIKNISIVRKSLVATRKICKGETIKADMVTAKRPGGGLSPFLLWSVVGSVVEKDYSKDEAL